MWLSSALEVRYEEPVGGSQLERGQLRMLGNIWGMF